MAAALLLRVFMLLLVGLAHCKLFPIEFRVPLGGEQPAPGDVWPKPWSVNSSTTLYTLDKGHFKFTSNLDSSCDIIRQALSRYTDILFVDSRFRPDTKLTTIEQVEVHVTEATCGYPNHEEDESYRLEVPAPDQAHGAKIEATTVWGALRGLETFSQLVYVVESANDHLQYLGGTVIVDSPRYKYRGVLLDTARHYLPKRILLANLDAMAQNKFNVFHWHLVDDQSFPLVSKKYPTIHEKGAYTPKHIYTEQDVQDVIEYARLRGIRVIPELDTPGHTHAMARAYPELLTPCYGRDGKLGPDFYNSAITGHIGHSESEVLNPMNNFTFEFMKDLFQEFKDTFKDAYIHLGMDEVFFSCWQSNPEVARFMAANGMKDYKDLLDYYVHKTLDNVRELGYKYIVWQDPVDDGVYPANDSIVAVWKDVNLDSSMKPWETYIQAVAKKGYQIILGAPWYLNYVNYPYPGYDWEKYYVVDPRAFPGTEAERNLVIGGQANIWGEFVDHTNVLSRFWPRASAVGERLWSDPAATRDVASARHRLDLQRCRMLRRGIPAAPLINGYCGDWEVDQVFDGPGSIYHTGAGFAAALGPPVWSLMIVQLMFACLAAF